MKYKYKPKHNKSKPSPLPHTPPCSNELERNLFTFNATSIESIDDDECVMSTDEEQEQPSITPDTSINRFSVWWILARWPLLIIIGASIMLDLCMYYTVRQCVGIYEGFFVWVGRRAKLRLAVLKSTTYKEWSEAAQKLDDSVNTTLWIDEAPSPYCNQDLIKKMINKLSKKRILIEKYIQSTKIDKAREIMDNFIKLILHCIQKNVGGIESESLYSQTYFYAKSIVGEYVVEISRALEYCAASPIILKADKLKLLEKAAQVYGRSALCLSGVGVVKALMSTNTLPSVITGTSAGSFIAAIICVRTDKEINDDVFSNVFYKECCACNLSTKERWMNWIATGSMFKSKEWYQKIVAVLRGEYTFREAYERTGRILNISVVPDELYATSCKQLNYITTPDVIIASAVMASSSVPGILEPQTLLEKDAKGKIKAFRGAGKKWRDGSLNSDIPEQDLHLFFDVNYTIVSQVNPHVIPFFYEREGSAGSPPAHRYGQGWRGGFIGSALTQHFKLDLLRLMLLLKDLDLLPKVGGANVSDIFLQKFYGSVTIVPPVKMKDYWYILTDPNKARMREYTEDGQLRTWPKINMIRNRVVIEQKLLELIKSCQNTSE